MLNYYFKRILQKITGKEYSFSFGYNSKAYLQNPPGSLKNVVYHPEKIPDLEFFIKRVKKGDVYFDVGANYGFFSLMLHNQTQGDIDIHCFEPSDSAFRVLAENNYLNGENWKLHKLAVGDKRNWLQIENEQGGYNHIKFEASKSTKPAFTITLDDYIQTNAIEKIDLMKVDVEGFEWFVLQGAKESFSKKIIKKILLENQGHQERYQTDDQSIPNFFTKLGYKVIDSIEGHECWGID